MPQSTAEQLNSKSVFRFAEVLQLEDNLPTSSNVSISRNSFGRRIKVRLIEDTKNLNVDELPWVFPLLPKHLQITPKVGEMVLVFFPMLDSPKGNRFYIGPIISQDYYLNHGGKYEALSLLQGVSTKPLCHPSGNSANDGAYPDSDTIAVQGRGDAAMWIKDEELRLMCGFKPNWENRSMVERADPGSLEFNRKSLSYIQMKYDHFTDATNKQEYNSAVNVVADRINLISHNGADRKNFVVNDQTELMTKDTIEKVVNSAESMVYGDSLIDFLNQFRQVFRDHTHHWLNDPQVVCEKDADFWNKDLTELLCKTIKVV